MWGILPEAGGLFDQPAGLLTRMTLALNVFDACRSAARAPDWSKWAEDNPNAAEIYTWAMRLRDAD
jgi:hypothetical protein